MTRIAAIMILFIAMGFGQTSEDPDATAIIKKADENTRGETSKGTMSMTIVRPEWSRTIKMKSWSKGDKYFMILITAPAKEKGQVFLKRDKEMWQWIPDIKKEVKIPPSMMMQSWMGSDFTNDDLVQQSSMVKDYTHEYLGTDTLKGYPCHKIKLTPKEDAAVVWGKIFLWITEEGYHIIHAKYYDEDEKLVHYEYGSKIKKFNDRSSISKITMVQANKKGHKTIIEINTMEFNKPISDNFFTKQNMKKVR